MGEEERAGLVEGCTVRAWRSASAQIRRWTPEDRLRAALARQVSEAVDRALDGWTPPQVRETVPIRGTSPEDYRYRILSTENGETFVAGIRFKGGDLSARFVEVHARDHHIVDRRALARMAGVAREAFRVFSPAQMRVHVPVEGAEERAVSGPGVTTDLLTVAGRISDLRRIVPPPRMDRVRLEVAGSASFYDRYVRAYEDVLAGRPDLEGMVLAEPLEEVERYVEEGLLREVYVDGSWAGVVCAAESPFYGADGHEMIEEVLAKRFRGKGLAPALQRHLIETLLGSENAILHGTIDASNEPSLRTAKRVGRAVVMVSRFADLEPGALLD